MSLNQYFKPFLLFFLISGLFGKILIPESNDEYPEFLNKNDKSREYYEITNKGLEYIVKGPAEIKIFAKAAFPKRTINEAKAFSYNILINDLLTVSENSKNIDRNISSLSHPMHVYTYSAKDVLVVPSGDYVIKINKNSFFGNPPILVRLSRSGRKSKNNIKEEFEFPSPSSVYKLKTIKSDFQPSYRSLKVNQPLFLNDIDGLLEFNLRGLHENISSAPEIVKATLLKNGKENTKYHIWSSPHPSTTIVGDDRIPGKLNKIYIQLNQNNYLFNLQGDNSKELFIKLNRFVK